MTWLRRIALGAGLVGVAVAANHLLQKVTNYDAQLRELETSADDAMAMPAEERHQRLRKVLMTSLSSSAWDGMAATQSLQKRHNHLIRRVTDELRKF